MTVEQMTLWSQICLGSTIFFLVAAVAMFFLLEIRKAANIVFGTRLFAASDKKKKGREKAGRVSTQELMSRQAAASAKLKTGKLATQMEAQEQAPDSKDPYKRYGPSGRLRPKPGHGKQAQEKNAIRETAFLAKDGDQTAMIRKEPENAGTTLLREAETGETSLLIEPEVMGTALLLEPESKGTTLPEKADRAGTTLLRAGETGETALLGAAEAGGTAFTVEPEGAGTVLLGKIDTGGTALLLEPEAKKTVLQVAYRDRKMTLQSGTGEHERERFKEPALNTVPESGGLKLVVDLTYIHTPVIL